jgi:AcrR family transcriptional regulator
MPKTARKTQEIRRIKQEILDSALNIINEDGIDNLSMRKLAKAMKMSAANLYNYYKSKENIIATLDTKGFKELSQIIRNKVNSVESSIEKIELLIREYIKFGTNPKRVHQYNIMFNRARVHDYKGMKGLEDYVEYQTRKAFKILDISYEIISDYFKNNANIQDKDPKIFTLRIWIELHGIVSFFNNRLLNELRYSDNFKEFAEDPRETVNQLTEELINSIISGDL